MKQLHSNANDRDVFYFVKDMVESSDCDETTARIAVDTLAEWKSRKETTDEEKDRIEELEAEVKDLEEAIATARSALDDV